MTIKFHSAKLILLSVFFLSILSGCTPSDNPAQLTHYWACVDGCYFYNDNVVLDNEEELTLMCRELCTMKFERYNLSMNQIWLDG